jgi:ParB-like chromosome segregation protein Spo0J
VNKAPIHVTDYRRVPLNAVTPHPDNARTGNIEVIASSLRHHGQYRPIVAQKSTKHILAGNHTWRAAQSLGWTDIAVTWLDVDDATARKVLIADNRASDLATYDNDALLNVLRSLPTLDGTGYDTYDVEKLEGLFNTGGEGGALKTPVARPDIRLGTYDMWLTLPALSELQDRVRQESKAATARHLRYTLGFPPVAPTSRKPTKSEQHIPTESADLVNIADLQPYDRNARQGDVGAISESLRTLGQFRPIVVNRRTNRILVGNHTWKAAKMLGWTQIAVAWLDVDEDTESRIVLIDNRSADLASYDDDRLLALLTSTDLKGTGFSGDDIDELLADVSSGRHHRNPAKTSDVGCRVDTWTWKVPRADFDAWDDNPDQYTIIAQRLNLPLESWTTEAPQ